MRLQMSVSGTYVSFSTLSPALQRTPDHLHVTTLAGPGACLEDEMAYGAGVIARMERGCYAHVADGDSGGGDTLKKVSVYLHSYSKETLS